MRIRRKQDVDTLSVVARLAEAGTVTARARVRLRGGSARLIVSRSARGQCVGEPGYGGCGSGFVAPPCAGSSASCVEGCASAPG